MNVGERGKRFFITITLLMMFVLSIGTIALATVSESRTSPYSLLIEKKLPEGSPAEAYEKEYRFLIKGTNGTSPIKEEVIIKGEGEKRLELGPNAAISIIEIQNKDDMDKITAADGTEYALQDISFTSAMKVPERETTLSLSKDEGYITVEKPMAEDAPDNTYTYRVTATKAGSPDDVIYQEDVDVKMGESQTLTGLPRGAYKVEELKVFGFQVKADDPGIQVPAGEAGNVTVNGNNGTLEITANGTPGDGKKHWYDVSGPWNWTPRNERFEIESGGGI